MAEGLISGPIQKVVIVDPWNTETPDGAAQVSNRQLLQNITEPLQISSIANPVAISQPVEMTQSEDETPNTFISVANVTITNETTIWTPGSGKKFKLLGGLLSYLTTSAIVELIDGVGGPTIFTLPEVVLSTAFEFTIPGGITSASADNVLRANGGTLQVLTGTIWGREVD